MTSIDYDGKLKRVFLGLSQGRLLVVSKFLPGTRYDARSVVMYLSFSKLFYEV